MKQIRLRIRGERLAISPSEENTGDERRNTKEEGEEFTWSEERIIDYDEKVRIR